MTSTNVRFFFLSFRVSHSSVISVYTQSICFLCLLYRLPAFFLVLIFPRGGVTECVAQRQHGYTLHATLPPSLVRNAVRIAVAQYAGAFLSFFFLVAIFSTLLFPFFFVHVSFVLLLLIIAIRFT